MGNLRVDIVYLDGWVLYVALFIYLFVLIAGFLFAVMYMKRNFQYNRLNKKYLRIRKEISTAYTEKEKMLDKLNETEDILSANHSEYEKLKAEFDEFKNDIEASLKNNEKFQKILEQTRKVCYAIGANPTIEVESNE